MEPGFLGSELRVVSEDEINDAIDNSIELEKGFRKA